MRTHALVATLALCACQPTVQQAPFDRQTTVRAELPVRVSWVETSRSPDGAVLVARIERIAPLDTPFTVQVTVPAGVVVKSGRTRFVLPPNPEQALDDEVLVLAWTAPPADDATLAVDADTGSLGVHFRVPYRFGRQAPAETPPAATGPSLQLRDRNLGPTIPIRPVQ